MHLLLLELIFKPGNNLFQRLCNYLNVWRHRGRHFNLAFSNLKLEVPSRLGFPTWSRRWFATENRRTYPCLSLKLTNLKCVTNTIVFSIHTRKLRLSQKTRLIFFFFWTRKRLILIPKERNKCEISVAFNFPVQLPVTPSSVFFRTSCGKERGIAFSKTKKKKSLKTVLKGRP